MKNLEVMKRIFEVFHEAVYIVDKDRKILYFNPVASKISGFSREEIEGKHCFDNTLNHIDDTGKKLCIDGCPLLESIRHKVTTDHYVYLHHKKGYRIRVHVRSVPLFEDGIVEGAIEVFTDETEKNLVINEVVLQKELALIDPLTGLFNRRYLDEKFFNDFKEDLEQDDLGILFIDLDNFKQVNDVFGHLVGDEVLRTVSQTILHNIRSNDYAIRYGGEEIIVLLKNIIKDELHKMAERIRILTESSSTRHTKHNLTTTISIGATLHKPKDQIYQTIHRADLAMYQAKRLGKNQTILES